MTDTENQMNAVERMLEYRHRIEHEVLSTRNTQTQISFIARIDTCKSYFFSFLDLSFYKFLKIVI